MDESPDCVSGNNDSGIDKSAAAPDADIQKTLFFNYHEYALSLYQDVTAYGLGPLIEHQRRIIATHFPNPYAAPNTADAMDTRIVRIPRSYEVEADRYPQFSTLLPGDEKGAYTDGEGTKEFKIVGCVEGQYYGYTSVSPLSRYLTADEFLQLVEDINKFLKQSFDPLSWKTFLWNIFDTATFFVFSHLPTKLLSPDVNATLRLERYVEEQNEKFRQKHVPVKIIRPRKGGYLSLDFQIPKPTP
ncbi:unnamed protein product [Kuraishia capsulata CBS 1993]|uniref:Ras modification protein ERF4 n=1 Tax=Kuraishia capsulata CBS 1993 TaxID=1382522 RepID=W6MU86_9ASCO|nr:uncharacterized protein KUCA_T00004963001 [Kuraishia capsulata CBS 1993]CDK28977.1 unnamed protein product [Kuraishia capsulata CBS 1993]